MQDDFNTPEVIAALFEAARRAGQEVSDRPETAREFATLRDTLEEVLDILGFDLTEGRVHTVELAGELGGKGSFTGHLTVGFTQEELPQEVLKMVAKREQARREKDWATADKLRDELHAEGWVVEDTSEGPILRR
jgi:cysteinyl-tRNA synthetase